MIDLFNQMAFPLASCIAMGYYVWHTTETHRQDIKEMQATHRETESSIMEAISNNTAVMTRLCTLLGKEEILNEDNN